MTIKRYLFLLVLVDLLLASCNSGATEEAAPVAATEEVKATATTAPTNTPEPTPSATATATIAATNTPEPIPTLASMHFAPVLPQSQRMLPAPEENSTFDSIYTDTGAVVYHDGLFHIFYNAIFNWPPQKILIGYATSPDGVNWTRSGEETLLRAEDVSYAGHTLLVSNVFVEEDGTWVMYFYTWPQMAINVTSAIGRATAPSPTGPWTADPAPVLEVSENDWESFSVFNPYVVRHDGRYYLYYTGSSTANLESAIGVATSDDGLNWTRHDAPILQVGEFDWHARKIAAPKVIQTAVGWLMIYRNDPLSGGPQTLGLAQSQDGLDWQFSQDTPVLDAGEYDSWNAFWATDFLEVDGTYYLFAEVGISGDGTDVHVTTFTP